MRVENVFKILIASKTYCLPNTLVFSCKGHAKDCLKYQITPVLPNGEKIQKHMCTYMCDKNVRCVELRLPPVTKSADLLEKTTNNTN